MKERAETPTPASDGNPASQLDRKLKFAFKVGAILLTVIVCESILLIALIWMLGKSRSRSPTRHGSFLFQISRPDDNMVQKAFPHVDFSRIYPGLGLAEIDQLQRECFSLRYVYAPFVEFRPLPVAKRFVSVADAGFRRGGSEQPWPPQERDFVVFVFGGSTTFGYGVRNEETVVAELERALRELRPALNIQCYNFGRGYYFSTQERILFETLLERGHVPKLAIFIDGLNDYNYPDGRPELTETLYAYTAPDLPADPVPAIFTEQEKIIAVGRLLERYKNNIRMIKAVADAHHIATLFVGQPVPFLNYPIKPETYPFPLASAGPDLGRWGYDRFKKAALNGEFGSNFLWCGDAFSDATNSMYADSIHYSPAGAKASARTIVARASQQQLLPAQ